MNFVFCFTGTQIFVMITSILLNAIFLIIVSIANSLLFLDFIRLFFFVIYSVFSSFTIFSFVMLFISILGLFIFIRLLGYAHLHILISYAIVMFFGVKESYFLQFCPNWKLSEWKNSGLISFSVDNCPVFVGKMYQVG